MGTATLDIKKPEENGLHPHTFAAATLFAAQEPQAPSRAAASFSTSMPFSTSRQPWQTPGTKPDRHLPSEFRHSEKEWRALESYDRWQRGERLTATLCSV